MKRKEHYKTQIEKLSKMASNLYGEEYYNRIMSHGGKQEYVLRKYAIYYVMYKEFNIPYQEIMDFFKIKKSHSTVLYGVNKCKEWMDIYPNYEKDFVTPYRNICKTLGDSVEGTSIKEYYDIALKWYYMNMFDELKTFTDNMEEKTKSVIALITDVEDNGMRVERNPDTIFVPSGTEDDELSIEMKILRNKYGFMIQTEIT